MLLGSIPRCLVFSTISVSLYAGQAPPVQWTKTYGGSGTQLLHSLIQTQDDGFLLLGETTIPTGTDVYLVKTDQNGIQQWERTFGGPNKDVGYSLTFSGQGGFIIAGATYSFGATGSDVYVIATEPNGNEKWHKTFGGIGNDWGWSIDQTSDGGFVVAGSTNNASDALVIRIDSAGNALWQTTIGDPILDDNAYAIRYTSDSGFILTGVTSYTDPDYPYWYGWSQAWLAKLNSSGHLVWENRFGPGAELLGTREGARSVLETSDGGYTVVGATTTFAQDELSPLYHDVYFLKTGPTGYEQWHRVFGDELSNGGISHAITRDGGYIIAASTSTYSRDSDIYIVKTDTDGLEEWSGVLGSTRTDYPSQVFQTSDGGYAIGGYSNSYGSTYDFLVIRIKGQPHLPPQATFSYTPAKPMVGGQVLCDASGSSSPGGNIVRYDWNFGDNTPVGENSPLSAHMYTSPGKYTVTLTVTDDRGATNTITRDIDLRLEKGDILLCRSDLSFVPFQEWTHAGIYFGNNQVIEAVQSSTRGPEKVTGVIVSELSDWSWDNMTYVMALRVNASVDIRTAAADYAYTRLDSPYDIWSILTSDAQLDGSSWYCSELVWASYWLASWGQVNLDRDESGAVSPDDIALDDDVEILGEHKESKPEVLFSYDRCLGGVAYCPVDLRVLGPDGWFLDGTISSIPHALYYEADVNGDADADDIFVIPNPREGDYYISVIPEAGAAHDDTFTLELLSYNGDDVTLATNEFIRSSRDVPYRIRLSETGVIKAVASVDIKPGSCPNPVSLSMSPDKCNGVLSVALLGSDVFNVLAVMAESVTLNGVEPVRWSIGDVGTPLSVDKSEYCACEELTGDGILDLVFKFEMCDIRQMFVTDPPGGLPPDILGIIGVEVGLTLEGFREDGMPFEGNDCVRILLKGDANGDGNLDMADAIAMILAMYYNRTGGTDPEVLDVNGDSLVDLSDVICVLQELFWFS